MDKTKEQNEYARILRSSKISRILWAFLATTSLITFCGLTIFFVRVVTRSNIFGWILWGGYTLIIMYVAFAGFWAAKELAFNRKLVVTSNGIWYHYFGKRFYTWDALVELEVVHSFLFSVWLIHTNEAETTFPDRIHQWILRGKWGYSSNFIELPTMPRSIHTVENFKATEFGQDLYQYAPHLFEDDEDDKPKNQLHDDSIDEAQPEWVADMSAKRKAGK